MSAHMCPDDHAHATTGTCYHQHRCRCGECVTAANAYEVTRRRLKAYGRWQPLVDATPVREHLTALAAARIGHRRVGELTRITANHIRDIRNGHVQKVKPAAAEKILAIAVDGTHRAAGAFVDARGTARRVQALIALGWTSRAIAAPVGIYPNNLMRITRQQYVTHRFAEAVATAYEELSVTVPPAGRERDAQRRTARKRGWAPPLAWDDIDLDDEPATDEESDEVDVIAIELATSGTTVTLTRAERHAVVRQLNAAGREDGYIALAAGVNIKTIQRDREELDIPAAVGSDRQPILDRALAA